MLAAGVLAVLFAGGATWLWMERMPIATSYIDDALKSGNVPASYQLTKVGFRTQRIERIRIGDPFHPDLTADWAEIGVAVGPSGVRVRVIDAGGVLLRGRLIGGKLSLGAIDRLLPPTRSGQVFALPDIALTARSMRLELQTPQGLVRATLDGSGNLHDGFRGRLGVASDRLAVGDCIATVPTARLTVAIDDGRPRIRGPVAAPLLTCAAGALTAPRIDIEAQGDPDLTRWRGTMVMAGGRLIAQGVTAVRLGGRAAFDASARRVNGKGRLFADQMAYAGVNAHRFSFDGTYRFDPVQLRALIEGDAKLSGARLDPAIAGRYTRRMTAAEGTPIGPILAAWGKAFRQAAMGFDTTAHVSTSHGPAGGRLRLRLLQATMTSGGRLSFRAEQGGGLGWDWPRSGPVLNASLDLAGGNLPGLQMRLRQAGPGGPLTGSATATDYQAGNARLRLAPIRIGTDSRGTLLSTRVTLDGPLADGRVEGLDLPIAVSIRPGGAFIVNGGCEPLDFDRLTIAGTVIGKTSLALCPVGGALVGRGGGGVYGGARIAAPRLRGRVGDQPLTMAARSLAVSIGESGFRLDGLTVRLGDTAAPTRLDVALVEGRVDAQGLSGRFAGAAGNIAVVPMLLSQGGGGWRLALSRLVLDGTVTVADADVASPRFNPQIANDLHLTLEGGRVGVTATLREPRSGLPITRAAIRHDLSSGAGDARLDVVDLRFGKVLQPEAVTPLTLGMIANVEGALSGQGRIRWAGGHIVSDGEFSTERLNLAAAFGPVTGLKGTIRFVDLLGLVTAPDQQLTIEEINPGIAVTDGLIRYRILPDRKLAVTDGVWPFAGGVLTLEPTTLDMVQPVARRLTFRIAGLDAATFVQQLEFKNLAVTGKFDGVLPIVFDARGGRIEQGALTVRPAGGTLSYVGDVTNANLGRVARIAFDALKSMRYKRLTIDLDGDLDGEIVSRVRFDGTNSRPEETARAQGIVGHILAPLTRMPFRFNITITAPFRGLVNSAQTFVDPSLVIRNSRASAVPAAPVEPTPIQPR